MVLRDFFKALFIMIGLAIMPGFFQSCSRETPQLQDRGIKGGSLSVTYAGRVYELNHGRVDAYVEQYDDKTNSHSIDLLKLPSPMLSPITTVPVSREFVILLVNAHLSHSARLQINNDFYTLKEYHAMTLSYLKGNNKALPKLRPQYIQALKLIFNQDTFSKKGLLETRIDCVAYNRPGQKAEHRNGALTLQIIDSTVHAFDAVSMAVSEKSEIYSEYSIFAIHPKGVCY